MTKWEILTVKQWFDIYVIKRLFFKHCISVCLHKLIAGDKARVVRNLASDHIIPQVLHKTFW